MRYNLFNIYGSIKQVISLRNISKVFFTFFFYINGLCFTVHGELITCHFISINNQTACVYKYQIHSNENTATYFKYIPKKTQQHTLIKYIAKKTQQHTCTLTP